MSVEHKLGTPSADIATEASSAAARTGLIALCVAAFLVALDRAIFAPLLPAIANDLGTSIGAAGLAVTAYVVPYGLFQLLYGPLGDRVGKIAVVRWAVLVFAIGTALCGLAQQLWALDFLRALTGACAAAVIPLALAYIGDVVPYERRQATIANLMGATALGGALSTAVGGIVADLLSWRELFGLYGVCALGLTAVLFRIPSGRPAAPDGPGSGLAATWLRSLGLLRLSRARRLYLLVGLEGLFNFGGFTYLGALLQDRYGLDYFHIGLVLACYGLGTLLTSRLLRWLLDRLGERGLILWGGLLFGGAYLALEPLRTWQPYIPILLLMGAGFSMFHSTLQVRATQLVPSMRGAAVSLFAFSLFSGAGIGTALFGLLATGGAYTALLMVAGLGQVAITLGAWLDREPNAH